MKIDDNFEPTDRLLNIESVRKIIPISKSTIWAKVKEGTFPQPVNIYNRTFWRLSEINAVIEGAFGNT